MAKAAARNTAAAGSTEPAADKTVIATPQDGESAVDSATAQGAGPGNGAGETPLQGDVARGSASAPEGVSQAAKITNAAVESTALETIEEVPAFPRLVEIINDTPIPYVIQGTHVPGNTVEQVIAYDQDQITRMKSDCEQIVALNAGYQGDNVAALRVGEVE